MVRKIIAIFQYSNRRIAEMLGITADNARQLHHRARERLCQMLTDQYKEKEKRKKGLFMIILFASLKRVHATRAASTASTVRVCRDTRWNPWVSTNAPW